MKAYIKKNLVRATLLYAFILVPVFVPIVSFAQTQTNTQTNTSLAVNCDGTATTTDANGTPPCNFNTFIDTGTHLIEWMFYVSVPVMVALMAYAGILYMTGIEKNIGKAKSMFLKVAGGFTVMLIAYVVINTLVGWIGNTSFTTNSSNGASNPAVLLSNSQ